MLESRGWTLQGNLPVPHPFDPAEAMRHHKNQHTRPQVCDQGRSTTDPDRGVGRRIAGRWAVRAQSLSICSSQETISPCRPLAAGDRAPIASVRCFKAERSPGAHEPERFQSFPILPLPKPQNPWVGTGI